MSWIEDSLISHGMIDHEDPSIIQITDDIDEIVESMVLQTARKQQLIDAARAEAEK